MINELYQGSKALKRCQLIGTSGNRNIDYAAHKSCLIIALDQGGAPDLLRFVEADQAVGLWRYRNGNCNSFPAIHIQRPLLSDSESKKIDAATWKKSNDAARRAWLLSLDFASINPNSKDICFTEPMRKNFATVLQGTEPDLEALRRLLRRFPDKTQRTPFYHALLEKLRVEISLSDGAELDAYRLLLVGKQDKKGIYQSGVLTYYDVSEADALSLRVADARTEEALLHHFSQQKGEGDAQLGTCAVTGQQMPLHREPYPQPNVPLLGQTYLYSKSSDIRCLSRYGMLDRAAFQAGEDTVALLSETLRFLANKDRKHQTWRPIESINHSKPNLLMVYLENDPQNDALLAQAMGGPIDDEADGTDEVDRLYEAACAQVLKDLGSMISINPHARVQLIILEALDKGRKQVTYSGACTVEAIQRNIDQWRTDERNHPRVTFHHYQRSPVKGAPRKKTTYAPRHIGPDAICRLLKQYYVKQSKKPHVSSEASYRDIYRLYMPDTLDVSQEDKQFLAGFLENAYLRVRDGLIEAGALKHRINLRKDSHPLSKGDLKTTCDSITLLAILLKRLGFSKEDYVMNVPFGLGQFLHLADRLHKEYSIHVRNCDNDQLPPRLIGNDVLLIVADNPPEGFGRLLERMKVYIAWVRNSNREGEGAEAWRLHDLYRKLCARLGKQDMPGTLDAAGKTQLLFGYLADIEDED